MWRVFIFAQTSSRRWCRVLASRLTDVLWASEQWEQFIIYNQGGRSAKDIRPSGQFRWMKADSFPLLMCFIDCSSFWIRLAEQICREMAEVTISQAEIEPNSGTQQWRWVRKRTFILFNSLPGTLGRQVHRRTKPESVHWEIPRKGNLVNRKEARSRPRLSQTENNLVWCGRGDTGWSEAETPAQFWTVRCGAQTACHECLYWGTQVWPVGWCWRKTQVKPTVWWR